MLTRTRRGLFITLAVSAAFLGTHAALAAATDHRLVRDVEPVSQSLELSLDPAATHYEGTTLVRLRVRESTSRIVLHAREIDLRRVELEDDAGPVPLRWGLRPGGRFEIETRRPLVRGDAALFVSFQNDFDRRANALYRFEHAGRPYLATQFQAVAAREAFPCWDEPGFKIRWTLTLRVPRDAVVVGNSPAARERVTGALRTVELRETPPLPSSLLALAVGPWDVVPLRGLSTPVRIVVPRGDSSRTASAAGVVRRVLPALERWFGSRQPFAKIDLVAVPEFAVGAMENPGAIFFRSSRLLHEPARFSAGERLDLATLLAHELAHLWFGDFVTPAWWDDLWLNEGFATFVAEDVVERVYPEARELPGSVERRESAYRRDAAPGAPPMRSRVDADDSPDLLFDELAYEKGAAVLRMLRGWLGERAFMAGVRAHLARHAWGNATAEDLWDALARASGHEVGAVARAFTDRPGVPHVKVSLEDARRVRLRTERWRAAGAPRESTVHTVPVAMLAHGPAGTEVVRVLVSCADTTLLLPHPVMWVHPNSDEAGYYRWSLDFATLEALLDDAGRLPPRAQAGLPAALGAMLRAGTLDGRGWVGAMRRLGAQTQDPALASALATTLREWRTTFGADEPRAAEAVREWLGPTARALGVTPRAGEPLAATLARPRVWRVLGDAGEDASRDSLWRAWTDAVLEGRGAPPPSLEALAFEGSAWRGDAAHFERVLAALAKERDAARRERWIAAVGSFRDPALVRRAVALAADDAFGVPDVSTLLDAASQGGRAEELADALEPLLPVLTRKLPDYALAQLATCWGGCSSARVARGRAAFARLPSPPAGGAGEFDKAEAEAAACAALRARVGAEISRALAEAP